MRKGPIEKFDFFCTPRTPFIPQYVFYFRVLHTERVFSSTYISSSGKNGPSPGLNGNWSEDFILQKKRFCTPPQTSKPSCYQEDKKNSLSKMSLSSLFVGFLQQKIKEIETRKLFLSKLKDMRKNIKRSASNKNFINRVKESI